MKRTINLLALALVGLLIGGFIAYAITAYLQIPGSGNLQLPATLTSNPTSIPFGNLYQGTIMTSNQTIQLTNTGDLATNPLSFFTTWTNPTTPLGTVASNITNTIIPAHSHRFYWFNLTITDTTYLGTFAFDITIQG